MKTILIVTLVTFAMNMRPVMGDSLAARMDKHQVAGWTIARVYDERDHFAGATIYDENVLPGTYNNGDYNSSEILIRQRRRRERSD